MLLSIIPAMSCLTYFWGYQCLLRYNIFSPDQNKPKCQMWIDWIDNHCILMNITFTMIIWWNHVGIIWSRKRLLIIEGIMTMYHDLIKLNWLSFSNWYCKLVWSWKSRTRDLESRGHSAEEALVYPTQQSLVSILA